MYGEGMVFRIKKTALIIMVILMLCTFVGCGKIKKDNLEYTSSYGVFLNYEGNLSELGEYETIVIDAQYISEQDIADFKAQGHTVYSYINVGSLENFRDYYPEFEDIMLGEYEHWEEEHWIDVSSKEWQDFILNNLSKELLHKGIDGFFVDNCDVYYEYPDSNILNGLSAMLEGLRATGKDVIINGGDSFVDAYCDAGGDWKNILTGINQESVFSCVNWDDGTFGRAKEDDHKYYTEYIEKYGKQGVEIFLLEYTADPVLIQEVQGYCNKNYFNYYITNRLELDAD